VIECKLSFVCSRTWEDLQPGSIDKVRFCDSCDTKVRAVLTVADYERHKQLGHCVAFLFANDPTLSVGMINVPYGASTRPSPVHSLAPSISSSFERSSACRAVPNFSGSRTRVRT
jgi:hypothetical protein